LRATAGRIILRARKHRMPKLTEVLADEAKKSAVIADCLVLIDQEVSDKGGISGLAIKAGYAAVKGVKPGFIKDAVTHLLPDFARVLDPLLEDAAQKGKPVGAHLQAESGRAADALLSITDDRAKRSDKGIVRATYDRLRPTAKKNVEAAVPRLSRLIEKHTR
jgi:hypothetical protein